MGERLYSQPTDHPRMKFCYWCNARDRMMTRQGKCSVCGQDPSPPPKMPADEMDWVWQDENGWAWWEYVILGGLIVATIYVLWQVSRWPI